VSEFFGAKKVIVSLSKDSSSVVFLFFLFGSFLTGGESESGVEEDEEVRDIGRGDSVVSVAPASGSTVGGRREAGGATGDFTKASRLSCLV